MKTVNVYQDPMLNHTVIVVTPPTIRYNHANDSQAYYTGDQGLVNSHIAGKIAKLVYEQVYNELSQISANSLVDNPFVNKYDISDEENDTLHETAKKMVGGTIAENAKIIEDQVINSYVVPENVTKKKGGIIGTTKYIKVSPPGTLPPKATKISDLAKVPAANVTWNELKAVISKNQLETKKPQEIMQSYHSKGDAINYKSHHHVDWYKTPTDYVSPGKTAYFQAGGMVGNYNVTSGGEIKEELAKVFPAVKAKVIHPETQHKQPLCDVIVSLNDSYQWTREKIADWLDTLSIDQRMYDKNGTPIEKDKK
jgi:hypothetical protein